VSEHPLVSWTEAGETRSARWRSEAGCRHPSAGQRRRRMTADAAYRWLRGTALAVARRFPECAPLLLALRGAPTANPDRPATPPRHNASRGLPPVSPGPVPARTPLGMPLLPFDDDYAFAANGHRRAASCAEAYGPGNGPFVLRCGNCWD